MIKNCLIAVALLSLALASGCAKGGNGIVPEIAVSSDPVNNNAIYPTQSLTITATVTGTSNMAVTWSVTGGGTITSATPLTATYVAPATPTTGVTVTATLTSDSSVTANLLITVVDVTTQVAPLTSNVGTNLTQQFTAIAIPDDAPETFTWTCTSASGAPCANFHQDANVSGLAYYKAEDNCGSGCIIQAASTLDSAGCANQPTFCTMGVATIVPSRVSGTYAFRFSGYDTAHNATAMVGTFTAASNGTISSGTEEELTSSGWQTHPITGGSYTPIALSDPNSNNAGTLTLTTAASTNSFQVVLDGAGDVEMVESDGHGTGSGIAQISAGSGVFNGAQIYAFGFTGVDLANKRVGYVGVFPMDGAGHIAGGQMDVNDNGHSSNSICSTPPCTVTGTYQLNANGSYQLTLTAPIAMTFDFYIASGSKNKKTPLSLYAISTDPKTNPAVSGTMVLQDSTQTYNTAALEGTSVSALTGVNETGTNVSLTQGFTDGNGTFSGGFDQNNAGTILTVPTSASAADFSYTYAATGTSGRYTFQMLGNPDITPATAPLPFVLYASGVNRGFLLDTSTTGVMTGTMNPQGNASEGVDSSEMTGTFGAATTSSGNSGVIPIAASLLTTVSTNQAGAESFNVTGTEYPSTPLAGTFNLGVAGRLNGTGTIMLTTPVQNYAIYVLDITGKGCNSGSNPVCGIQDFLMIDEDTSTTNPSIIFAKQ